MRISTELRTFEPSTQATSTNHPAKRVQSQKMFGLGLSRTGTTSLNTALEILGFSSCHFPADPITQIQVRRFLESGQGSLRLSLLETLDSLTDTPVCCIFKGLDAAYPQSKFILTLRDKEAWLDSCERYWQEVSIPSFRENPMQHSYARAINRHLYGVEHFNRRNFSRTFERYHRNVDDYFSRRPGQLLKLRICHGEGWQKLCSFLGSPVPDVPFPEQNKQRTGKNSLCPSR